MAAEQTVDTTQVSSWHLKTVDPTKVSSWQLNRQWTPKKLVHGSSVSGPQRSYFKAA